MTIDATVSRRELDAIYDLAKLRVIHSALIVARGTASKIPFVPGSSVMININDAVESVKTVIMGNIGTIRHERWQS